ncbi:hypothetical protein DN582_04770 [Burkholderia multivorans]|uniref:putative holin n=1 Tax=Burkholderia multivorans TaxID=87883 RepID=UPI000DAE2AA7|nr:putative holin [Burkholderia multivorans]RAC18810.1 hypothetical protein DN557_26225 [Burkholderia multivorans]RAC40386.1 hypothetical protein DN561_15250 [Burkholderia multivorans]RAE04582.1 hypothetical protein DN582_04770 [Burkholderia multivorans]RAG31954.1 hypothetical protein DN574_18980 [Burkholderia multivorans]
MAEPISTSSATAAALGVATLSLFPGVDANVVMGAFAGSLLFVMTAADPSIPKRVAFFVISFVAGCLTADLFAAGLDVVLPARIVVHAGIGALIASALVVKPLLWLIAQADAPDRLLNVFKGREK